MKCFVVPRNRLGRAALLALTIGCALLCSCSSVLMKGEGYRSSFSGCLPSFPDKDGWYGGDGAYSILLDDRRVLWLFGDTFVSDRPDRADRIGMEVVLGTTLAISTCGDDAEFRIKYYIKKDKGGYVSFFGEKEWLWPQDPFMVARTLYIPLIAVRSDPGREGPFKFRIAGHRIARIKNHAEEDPNQWSVEYLDLTPAIPEGIMAFAATAVVHGDHVYFYPLYGAAKDGRNVLGNILARIPAGKIDDPAQAIEYLTREGQWEKELDPAKVKVVLAAAVSELSVRYHPEEGKWIAVYLSLENNGDRMLYQTADAPEGPWDEPRILVESVPEVDRRSPRYGKNTFCYAGKEHLEFAWKRSLVVTYVCNSYEDFENKASFIRRNLFLYRPVVRNPRY